MTAFSLGRVPAIHSGAGSIRELPRHIRASGGGETILLVIDPGLGAGGYIDSISTLLESGGHQVMLAVAPPGEPREHFVRDTVAQVRSRRPSGVVCVGGGSTQDAGKLIACLSLEGDDVAAYRLAASPLPQRRLPLVCVPTTAGTGSEATTTAIIAEDGGTKNWFWADNLKPDLIVLDPELTLGLPAAITANTGMDALVHAIEAATNKRATAANNMYCYRAIELVTRHLVKALRQPGDIAARSAMQEAATLAGMGIDNAGTAIAHNIAHALGSLAHIPHGRAVAIGMCATLDWNIAGREAAYRGVAAAMGLGSVDQLPQAFTALTLEVGINLDLSAEAGSLTAPLLARQMQQAENLAMAEANCRRLDKEDFFVIATRVLTLDNTAIKTASLSSGATGPAPTQGGHQ